MVEKTESGLERIPKKGEQQAEAPKATTDEPMLTNPPDPLEQAVNLPVSLEKQEAENDTTGFGKDTIYLVNTESYIMKKCIDAVGELLKGEMAVNLFGADTPNEGRYRLIAELYRSVSDRLAPEESEEEGEGEGEGDNN